MSRNFHEQLDTGERVKAGSERSFGLVFAGFFALVGVAPWLHGTGPRYWALAVAAVFLVLSFAAPRVLRPLNQVWFQFGMLLSRVVSPIVMGLVFYLAVTPTSLLLSALGKDPLRLKREPKAPSYWVRRDPAGPAKGSLKNQF
jgi:hypothetical protein